MSLLSGYDSGQNLTSFLDVPELKPGAGANNPYQTPAETFLQKYDNAVYSGIDSTEDAYNTAEEATTNAVKSVENGIKSVKDSLNGFADTVAKTYNISKNVVIVGAVVLGVLFIWDKIGRDLYYIAEEKKVKVKK